jgi:outer membrane biogenesis lipoprotein LolB
MKTFSYVLMMLLLLLLLPGCGSDTEKGTNSPDKKKDLPRAAPSENKK